MPQEIEYPINLLIIIIGTFLCLTLGAFLFFNKSAKNNANLFLGGLVVVFFAFFLQAFLYRFHLLDNFPYLIGVGNSALFLLGPFAYFYVRACIQKGFHLRWIDGLHFIPFLLGFLSDIPTFLLSGEERIALYIAFITQGNIRDFNLGSDWLLIIKSLHGVVYFFISTQFILQYRKHLNNETSSIDSTFHRWMLFFIFLLAFPVGFLLVYIHVDYHRIFIPLQLLSFFLLLLATYVAALIKPELFHTFPHQMVMPASSEEQKQKYESSNLQDLQKEQYLEKLQTYVKREKPFLAPELTLAQLSEQAKIPTYHLSQVVNEKLNCNFLDYINTYRVKAAQDKLIDPKLSHYTILSIAYEAGFNSKSTFYTAFKKVTGMTPSQYRKKELV